MLSRPIEFSHRAVRWLGPATLLALAPKCVLCLLAYAGLGAAIGLGGPELCGAPAGTAGSWASMFAWLGGVGGLATFGLLANCRRTRRATPPLPLR